jgi:hypothetical protein
MPAQGELRGPKARNGGGDWDANADDFAEWVEPEPGDPCKALLIGSRSLLPEELAPDEVNSGAHICSNWAPVGSSICTPCYRRRIRTRNLRLSLERRTRTAEETGKPLEEIQ